MALTPEERLRRREVDPYFGLAEELAPPSLAQQKGISLAAATVEKNRRLDPAGALADESLAELEAQVRNVSGGGSESLLDIAESSMIQSREHLFDAISGNPLDRTSQDVLDFADDQAGVTEEGRQRLVGDKTQAVVDNLASASLAYDENRFGDMAIDTARGLGNAVLAGPAVAADSAGVLPELALGAAATALTGGLAAPVLARRLKKGADAVGAVTDAVKKTKATNKIFGRAKDMAIKGAKGAPKAAGQVSVAAVDITQRQANDFREKHGRNPTREEGLQMLGMNMITFMAQPTIIKNLFIPSFKKEVGKEIKQLAANFGAGSNMKAIGARLVDATKKVFAAGGAEAGQEYFQTWAENLNVGMGPEQRKDFMAGLKSIMSDGDAQMQATIGAFLGFGAGAAIRAVPAVPAVAAGTAVDTAKGVAKHAVSSTKKQLQAQANKAAFAVLSQEERDVIKSEFNSRKVNVDKKTKEIRTNEKFVHEAKSAAEIKANDATGVMAKALQEANELTDEDLRDPKTLKHFKAELERTYKAQVLGLRAELEASNVAAIAKKATKNVADKSVKAAKDLVDAIPVDVETVLKEAKKYGSAAVTAVKELESSTALGVIEAATRGTKAEAKAALKAAGDLSVHDLNRIAAVTGSSNPDFSNRIKKKIKEKTAQLKRVGLKTNVLLTQENVPPVIRDINESGTVSAENASTAATALNASVASKIDGVQTLEEIEGALKKYEESAVFKAQDLSTGVMSTESMNTLKVRLARKASGIREPVKKRLGKFMEKLEEKGIREILKDTSAVKKAAKLMNTDTAKGMMKWLKDHTPDLEALQTPEGQADLQASLQAGLERAVTSAEKVVKGEKKATADKAKRARGDREAAVLPKGPLKEKLELLEKALLNPDTAKDITAGVDKIYNSIKKAGIDTRDAFNDLVEQFPGLRNNNPFFTALDNLFPDPMAYSEPTDAQATTAKVNVEEAYYKLNSKECPI